MSFLENTDFFKEIPSLMIKYSAPNFGQKRLYLQCVSKVTSLNIIKKNANEMKAYILTKKKFF